MNSSTNINELAKALSQAQVKFASVTKQNAVDTGKYKYVYADLATILEAVRKPLSEHGLSVTAIVHSMSERGEVPVETVLMHESGQWISSTVALPVPGGGPQAMGSSITYARRYGLSGLLGIAAEEDDDAGKAEQAHQAAQAMKKNASAPAQVRPVDSKVFDKLMAELIGTEPGEGGRLHRLDLNGRVLQAKEAGELTHGQLDLLRATYKAKEATP